MSRNTKRNRKTQKKQKTPKRKQKTWTGGVRINKDFTRKYGKKTREECMEHFMENATFKLLTNNSISCMTILATLPNNYTSIFKSMRSNDIDISVRTILVKIFITIPTNEHAVYTTRYKRGNHSNKILITPISNFRQEIQTQKDIYRKSFISETSLLDPICPAILFFKDKTTELELKKYIDYFNQHDHTAYELLMDIIKSRETRPDIRVSTIYMEFMEGYQLVKNLFDSRSRTPILKSNLNYTQEEYKFFLKNIQYELYKLNKLGYIHNDAHLSNIMIDPYYDYFAIPDSDSNLLSPNYHIYSGKVILIDFGETEKLLPYVKPEESFLDERFMDWVPPDLRITLDEIREYEQYRKNYIEHISGPKILNLFNVRNKTLFELVQSMANQEQYITLGGKEKNQDILPSHVNWSHVIPIPKTSHNYVNSESKEMIPKNPRMNLTNEEKKLLSFITSYLDDTELESLLEKNPELT
jgi:hypothetical protein